MSLTESDATKFLPVFDGRDESFPHYKNRLLVVLDDLKLSRYLEDPPDDAKMEQDSDSMDSRQAAVTKLILSLGRNAYDKILPKRSESAHAIWQRVLSIYERPS